MAAADRRVRAELAADGSLFQGYHPRMSAVHDRHAARLAQILAERGWPTERHVGADGAEAAWLIVQHAIAQPEFQRRALEALSAAAARGEVPRRQAAMLEDRIRVLEGRPQRYGTQLDWDAAGRLSPLPIEDPAGIAERRKEVGLRTLDEEIERLRSAAAREGERPPADPAALRRERDAWLREAGWRSRTERPGTPHSGVTMTIPFAQSSFPEMYEQRLVGPLFRPFAEQVLEEIGLAPGDRVLDVACGTGIVARLAWERLGGTGTVVGVDLSPAMLGVARRLAPGIDWREGDAGALPLREGERFDVVVCQQGLQFFPDRLAAARRMHRALERGGRLAVSTWRPDEECPPLRELRRVAERHLGAIADRRHGFGEAGPLEALLRDAGFRDVRLKTVRRTIRFEEGAVFVRLNAIALVNMSTGAREMSDEERGRVVAVIEEESAAAVRPYTDGAGLAFELGANVARATV